MKPIPESWQYFHHFITVYSNDSKWSLTRCASEANCSVMMPHIYKALGWIKLKSTPNQWSFDIPAKLTPEMVEQIREESKRMENASDPFGLDALLAKPTGHTLTGEELKMIDQLAWKDAKPISFFADLELVSELRRRGYEVTAKKTVEL